MSETILIFGIVLVVSAVICGIWYGVAFAVLDVVFMLLPYLAVIAGIVLLICGLVRLGLIVIVAGALLALFRYFFW